MTRGASILLRFAGPAVLAAVLGTCRTTPDADECTKRYHPVHERYKLDCHGRDPAR